jgi:uncharacterized membrane protein (DUF4010 family)
LAVSVDTPVARYLILIGLGFFFGLAFEEYHAQEKRSRPGGVRSFPLLALAGAILYRIDPVNCVPLAVGLLVLGGWLACYYWQQARLGESDASGQDVREPDGRPADSGLMVPICNMLAYLLGPATLVEPPWVAVGATVAAVLLLTAREPLHRLARRIETAEIVTAGKFLILTGLILPLLPNQPVTSLTDITPHQVWIAVLAVCTVSYASYLLQRYIAPPGAGLWVALLGGLYSSTATTVVMARRAHTDTAGLAQTQAGIILATAVMYLRLLLIIFVFDRAMAYALAPWLLGLSALGLAMAAARYWMGRGSAKPIDDVRTSANPLELGAAAVFAVLFVAVSLATAWARTHFGASGIYVLAAIVGVSDIDPFVLSLAGHGAGAMPAQVAAVAVLIAASSNNLLKAGYAASFAGLQRSIIPVAALCGLAVCGGAAAWVVGAWVAETAS